MIKEDDHKKSYQLIIYQKTSVKKLHFFQIISPFSFSTPNQTYELLGIHCVKIGGKMKMLSNPLFVLWGVLSWLYSMCVVCTLLSKVVLSLVESIKVLIHSGQFFFGERTQLGSFGCIIQKRYYCLRVWIK